MIGYGCINLSLDENRFLYVKYEIDLQEGFRFFWIVPPDNFSREQVTPPQTISQVVPFLSSDDIPEPDISLVLLGLPSSPKDAFYNVSLGLDDQALSLTVDSGDEPFGYSPQKTTFFKNLSLTFTQALTTERAGAGGSAPLAVEGEVTAVVFGHDIPLAISLDRDAENEDLTLIFQPKGSLPKIPLPKWGEMEVTTFKVKPFPIREEATPFDRPKVLYLFGEKSGDTIHDCSSLGGDGSAAANSDIHLKINKPKSVLQSFGSIAIRENVLISSQGLDSQENSAKKIVEAFQKTSEITISAWLKPAKEEQQGPARIVTLSKDTTHRYFTLGHGEGRGTKSTNYTVRLRTSKSDDNGLENALNYSKSVTTELTHVVYTLKKHSNTKSNNTHEAKLYINGSEVISKPINASFDDPHPWDIDDSDIKLALGNEISAFNTNGRIVSARNRIWKGELYEVAIYDQALSPELIYQRYYPVLHIEGLLTLAHMPPPLQRPLPAKFIFANPFEQQEEPKTRLVVESEADLPVTEQFEFNSLELEWEAGADTPTSWNFSKGQVKSQLWGKNKILLTAEDGSTEQLGQLALVADPKDLSLTVFSNAEQLVLTELELSPVQSSPEVDWQWHMNSATDLEEIELPQAWDQRPFDWTVDLKLLFENTEDFSPLAIQDNRVILQGTWLGEPLALHGQFDGGYFTLQGVRSFRLPFRTSLGPVFEPGTSYRILDPAVIDSVMEIDLTVQLSELGFFASGIGEFEWADSTETVQVFKLPMFTVIHPPLTPNQVLESALATLQEKAEAIVSEHLRHEQDYYCQVLNGVPLIYLGSSKADIPSTQTIELPFLRAVGPGDGNGFSIEVGMFKLEENSGPGFTLTIKHPEITSSYPEALRSDYDGFIQQLDQQGKLTPGAVTLIKTRIAECLALPLKDSLYYYYGLKSSHLTPPRVKEDVNLEYKSVDLQAGMRLRVDYQNYQFVHPALSSASSGFVGSGTSYYSLNSYSKGSDFFINFDAFLSQLQPFVDAGIGKNGAAGSLDTFNYGHQSPYFRLIYPDQTTDSSSSLNPEQKATLVGAETVGELDDWSLEGNTNVSSFFFRGRATVIPEIAIIVNDQPTFVSVGTTLRQLMERFISISPSLPLGQSLAKATGKPRISRILHTEITSEPSYRFINLTDYPELFDLPLVKGDRIVFNA